MWRKCATDIFSYDDYRSFLRDAFRELKSVSKAFSHRYFAKKAGIASAGFVTLVINGQRNLSTRTLMKFCEGLKLTQPEKEYFEHLVHFTQANSSEEKAVFYKRMLKYRKNQSTKLLENYQYEYWSNWFFPAIRELALLDTFELDADWISKELGGQITVTQAQHALDVLFKLKLLNVSKDGNIEVANMSVTSGSEVVSLAIMNFHREMMRKAEHSLDSVKASLRDISSVTFTLDQAQIPERPIPAMRVAHFESFLEANKSGWKNFKLLKLHQDLKRLQKSGCRLNGRRKKRCSC